MNNDPLGNLLDPARMSTPSYLEPGATMPSQGGGGSLDLGGGDDDFDNWLDSTSGGLYSSDPGLASYLGMTNGTSVYNAGGGTSGNPSTGSLSYAISLVNSVAMAQGASQGIIAANRVDNYLDDGGNVLKQVAYESDNSGSYSYRASNSSLDGQTVTIAAGLIASTIAPVPDGLISDFVGGTLTAKTGLEFQDLKTAIGTFGFSNYSSVSRTGDERLFNLNVTQFNTGHETKTSFDANVNLFVYKLKITSDIGVETEFGSESSKIDLGLSYEKGISFGAAVLGHGFDVNYKPSAGVLAIAGTAIVAPELLSEVWNALTPAGL